MKPDYLVRHASAYERGLIYVLLALPVSSRYGNLPFTLRVPSSCILCARRPAWHGAWLAAWSCKRKKKRCTLTAHRSSASVGQERKKRPWQYGQVSEKSYQIFLGINPVRLCAGNIVGWSKGKGLAQPLHLFNPRPVCSWLISGWDALACLQVLLLYLV